MVDTLITPQLHDSLHILILADHAVSLLLCPHPRVPLSGAPVAGHLLVLEMKEQSSRAVATLLQSLTDCNSLPEQITEVSNSRHWPRILVVKGDQAQINMNHQGLNLNSHRYNPKHHISTFLSLYTSWHSIPAGC